MSPVWRFWGWTRLGLRRGRAANRAARIGPAHLRCGTALFALLVLTCSCGRSPERTAGESPPGAPGQPLVPPPAQPDRNVPDAFVDIVSPTEHIMGHGMESDQSLKNYRIFRVTGQRTTYE